MDSSFFSPLNFLKGSLTIKFEWEMGQFKGSSLFCASGIPVVGMEEACLDFDGLT